MGHADPAIADLLDVVGRVAFCRHLGDAVDGALEMVETQQERTVEHWHAAHGLLL